LAGALIVGGCIVVAVLARDVTFSGDDWSFLLNRRGWNADVFLMPHNEHLSALPVLAYKLLLAVFGASSYWPFMALLLVVHATVCWLLYVLARRYAGPWLALVAPAVLVVLGPAWHDLLWAFQVGYLGSVAAGLGTILSLEHRRDKAAAALLVVSLLCSSVGLAMLALAAVYLVLQRPFVWRRLWVVGVPVVLYLAWYAKYGVSTVNGSNVTRIPRYVGQALSAAIASITGVGQTHVSPFLVSTSVGRFFAIVALVALVGWLVRGGRPPALGWAALAAALALWVAECLEYFPNGREAAQSRYQYTAAVLLLLAGAFIIGRRRISLRAGVVLAGVTTLVCAANLVILHGRAAFWTDNAPYTAAETGAMEIARGIVSPNFGPEQDPFVVEVIGNHNLEPIQATTYFSAVDAFGSAADSPEAIMRETRFVRKAADVVLAGAERLTIRAGATPPAGSALCRNAATGAELGELSLRYGLISVRAQRGTPTALALARFGADEDLRYGDAPPPFAPTRLQDGRTMVMRLPRDRSSVPWRLRIVGGRAVRVCLARS
jgi:hypothetical protein